MHRTVAGWIAHRRAKWIVLALSLVLLAGLGSLAGKLTSVVDNDVASWLPGDAESTRVIERAAAFSDPDDVPAIVLYVRDGGTTPADLAKATADVEAIQGVKDVSGVVGPVPSEDGRALQVVATITLSDDGWERLPDRVEAIADLADRDAGGLDVSLAGPAALGADQAEAFSGIDGILLLAAVGIVFVILLITYRSLQLAVLFLFCGVGAVGIAQGVVYMLAKNLDLTVNAQSQGILSVLVLGAGVDYALLLVARYREELHRYEDRHEAMAHALHRAAPAILASGATVIIGLLCLMLAQMNSTASLGPVGAAGIACALLVMLVLLPALLVVVGRWIFWPFVPRFGQPVKSDTGVWASVGQRIQRAPRAVWVVTTLVLVGFSFGIVQLDADGLTNEQTFTKEQPSVAAEKELAEHFPGGAGSPVAVIARGDRADAVAEALAGVDGIDAASVAVRSPAGSPVGYVEGTLTSAPDSTDAFATIDRARDAVHAVDGAEALVGGTTAVNKDVQEASAADNRLIIPVVLVVVLLILGVLLRSIAAPLILLVTVVVSFAAAVGISALVFRHVFGFEGADSSFPLFAFVFLVALGIDYNIFLMTRVREESLKHGTRRGALIGLAATGGVITSAGFVLAGTFTALATLPIVFLAELGFVVALGVLLDTIIVRSVLVTALNLDIGRHIWWPSALWRTDGAATATDVAQPGDAVAAGGTADEPAHRA
jgi:RND superfamily putative drug exporter